MRLNFDAANLGSESVGGVAVYPFLRHFDSTFHQSGAVLLNKFIAENSEVKKWILLSDYIFKDKSKPRDVATFTFIPLPERHSLEELSSRIQVVAPSDIKHLSRVRPEFIELIKSYPTFSISIVLDRRRRVSMKERQALDADLSMLRRMVDGWPRQAGSEYYKNISRDFENLRKEIIGPGANMRVVRDLIIISNLAAYLALEFHAQIGKDTVLLWATDRDAMHGFLSKKCSGSLFYTFAHVLHHVLCEAKGLDSSASRLDFAVPEETGSLWYDAPLRIPDLICGSLADFPEVRGPIISSHQKFQPVIDSLLVHEESQLIFKVDFDAKTHEPKASRLVLGQKSA